MRRFQLFAVALPSLMLVSVAACEDASNGPLDITLPDAALPDAASPGFDGALPDAGTPDGDAAPPPLPVTVLVTDATGPKASVRILLHDATGAVTGETMTNATGLATMLTAPDMITVLDTVNSVASPVTFFGVAPGDALKVTETLVFDQAALGSISATITAGAFTANANQFIVYAGPQCSNSTGSLANGAAAVAVSMFNTCVHAQNTVLASAGNAGGITGFGFVKNVAAPTGGSIVNAGTIAFVAPGSRTFTATNLPNGPSVVGDGFATVGPDAFVLTKSGLIIEGGLTFQTAVSFADAYQTIVRADTSSGGDQFSTRIIRKEAAVAAAAGALTSTDFSEALPAMTGASLSTANGAARPEITFTTPGATGAHTGYAAISWFGNAGSGHWSFVFPGDQKTLKAPSLPADATAFVPPDAVTLVSGAYIDGSLVPDYATAKKLPIPANANIALLDLGPTLPLPGTVKVSAYRQLPR